MAKYEVRSLDNSIGKVWWDAGNEVWQFSVPDDEIRATLREIAIQSYVNERGGYQTSEIMATIIVQVSATSERFIVALSEYLVLNHEGVLGLKLDGRLT